MVADVGQGFTDDIREAMMEARGANLEDEGGQTLEERVISSSLKMIKGKNKELVERSHTMKNMIADSGSQHLIRLDDHLEGIIVISPKSAMSGFTYQLLIDGNPIEQNSARRRRRAPASGRRHLIRLKKKKARAPGACLPRVR